MRESASGKVSITQLQHMWKRVRCAGRSCSSALWLWLDAVPVVVWRLRESQELARKARSGRTALDRAGPGALVSIVLWTCADVPCVM